MTTPLRLPRPSHCPSAFDNRQYLRLIDEACASGLHEQLTGVEAELADWLADVAASTGTARLGRWTLPHPAYQGTGRTLEAPAEADPSTGYVFVAAGRVGEELATGLYVGLVAQTAGAAWHGVCGFFLPVCTSCDPSMRRAAERVAAMLPAGSRWLAEYQLPAGAETAEGWWDERLFAAHRLPGGDGGLWTVASLLSCAQGPAVLVRIGPLAGSWHNLIYVSKPDEGLPQLVDLLASAQQLAPSDVVAAVRGGKPAVLRRLAGEGDGDYVQSRLVTLRQYRTAPPEGWTLLQAPGLPEPALARSARASLRGLRELRTTLHWPVLVWTAPRLSSAGAVDWSALMDLRDQVALDGA